jgi:hypothetical protein
MNTYQEIDALFGAPLNTVIKPHIPFKIKTWHIVGGIIVLGLASYGGYKVYNQLFNDSDLKLKSNKTK